MIIGGTQPAPNLATHHNLRSHIARRLKEDRVHIDRRRNTRGFSLKRLGAAYLQAFDSCCGVQGHVLRFEGRHIVAIVCEDAAECRSEQGLANMRAGTQDHDGAGCHD